MKECVAALGHSCALDCTHKWVTLTQSHLAIFKCVTQQVRDFPVVAVTGGKKTPPECVSTLKLEGGGINKAIVWKIWGGGLVMVVWAALGSLLIKHRNDNGTGALKRCLEL